MSVSGCILRNVILGKILGIGEDERWRYVYRKWERHYLLQREERRWWGVRSSWKNEPSFPRLSWHFWHPSLRKLIPSTTRFFSVLFIFFYYFVIKNEVQLLNWIMVQNFLGKFHYPYIFRIKYAFFQKLLTSIFHKFESFFDHNFRSLLYIYKSIRSCIR